jgi:hypothetical protein
VGDGSFFDRALKGFGAEELKHGAHTLGESSEMK